MARYKHIDTSPRFFAVDLQRLPGTFEHALNHLLDHELDLSGFDARFCNDETGAAAHPPAMLLKVVLFAYSQPGRVGTFKCPRGAVIEIPARSTHRIGLNNLYVIFASVIRMSVPSPAYPAVLGRLLLRRTE